MKITKCVANYIRRCGYAVALTLVAGSMLPAYGGVIDYIPHDGSSTDISSRTSEYEFSLGLAMPTVSKDTPVWNTASILDAVKNGDGDIRGWCPWRGNHKPDYNYEIFLPGAKGRVYTTYDQYSSNDISGIETKISYAIRPDLQNAATGLDDINVQNTNKHAATRISYVGPRSLLPAVEDSRSFFYTQDVFDAGEVWERNRYDNGMEKTGAYLVYDEKGEVITYNGQPVYTTRVGYQAHYKVGDEYVPIEGLDLGDITALRSGDTVGGIQALLKGINTPVNVHDNTMVVDHSGFMLLLGAYSQYGDVYNNATYIQDVRVSDDIYGVSTKRGLSHDNTLVVIRAQAIGQDLTWSDKQAGAGPYNNGGKIYAVWSTGADTNDAYNNTAFFHGVSSYQEVGAAVASGNVTDNLLFINRSNIATGTADVDPVIGGYAITNGTAENNIVIIDDNYTNPDIPKEVVDDTVAGGWTARTPEVTTVYEDVSGAKSENGTGSNGAHNNTLLIFGKTAYDAVDKKMVTTTIQGNVFGGVAGNEDLSDEPAGVSAGSATGNHVEIRNAVIDNRVSVPVLLSTTEQEDIWGTKKISTDVGRICGGYVGAPEEGRKAGNANDNTVVIIDSKVTNSVYGGSNEGNGEASGNELHLSHVDTTGPDGTSYQIRTFYGGWINSYEDGGRTNNNSVWLYDSGWSMDQTFLHGGWGNDLVHNINGEIMSAVSMGTQPLIKGATSFDGSHFMDAAGNTLATVELSKVVKNDGANTSIFDNVTAFDGGNFYDANRNQMGTFEEMVVMTPAGKDVLSAAASIDIKKNGNVVFLTEDKKVIASFNKESGSITKPDGSVIASGIKEYNAATQSFRNLADTDDVIIIAHGAIVKKSDVVVHGIQSYVLNHETGDLEFKDGEGTTLATFVSSTIVGKDIDDNPVRIDIPDSEVDKSNVHMVKRGEINDLFAKLDGYEEYDTYTRGNWLHVVEFQGKLRGIDHFERILFTVPEKWNPNEPLITLTGDTATDLTMVTEPGGKPVPVTLGVDVSNIVDRLKPGDEILLIGHDTPKKIAGLDDIDANQDEYVKVPKVRRGLHTIGFDYDFDVNANEQALIRILARTVEAVPEAKALVEGRIATLSFNNAAGNLVAEQGIEAACRAAGQAAPVVEVETDEKGASVRAIEPRDELDPGRRLFFAMSGGHNRVESGSHVDVDGINAVLGIAGDLTGERALTLGAYIETGRAQYTTHNSFAELPHARGTGETDYVGGGALLRYRFDKVSPRLKGWMVDASVRVGRQTTDYTCTDINDGNGNYADYEHDLDYIAGHVGLSYTWKASDRLASTFYGRYLWARIDGDESPILGDRVEFEDVSSNRLRFGTRMTWKATEKWTPYAGLAYEWECSGTARANTMGAPISAPSMHGGSVIGELGTVWQPNPAKPLWFDFAVQGSAGRNTGVAGKLGVTIGF